MLQVFTDSVYYFIFPLFLVSKTFTQSCQILREHKASYGEIEQWWNGDSKFTNLQKQPSMIYGVK